MTPDELTDEPLDEATTQALQDAVAPKHRMLRATRAYLLPRQVRLGLELALRPVHEGLMHEVMHDLEGSPIEELGQALAEDLAAILDGAEELLTDAAGASLTQPEIRITAAAEQVRNTVQRSLRDLRRALHPSPSKSGPSLGDEGDED